MNPLTQQQLLAATDAAVAELHRKSIETVQQETAVTWAGRAAAAYHLYIQNGHMQMLLDAEEYHHEALEHAALVSSDPGILEAVRHYLTAVKADALGDHYP
ncbi:MAG TPA: hypothetical protein VFA98_06570 [Thermoanaerobaculia bacterium]|jgi:hypothetical protein|nr:hypothetical protein [Thermoanaerobaculia bacterium]